jgi:uncharacterized repeat protein (TIGR03803 family)
MKNVRCWKAASCLLYVVAVIPAAAQTFTTLVSFDGTDGAEPANVLVQGIDGNFYGTTAGGGAAGTVFKMTPTGTLTTLYSFCSQPGCTDGIILPFGLGALLQASDGNFYGTTQEGGANHGCANPSCGTIFKITPAGTLTTIYSFCAQTNCTDGSFPNALAQGTDGNFYGTAEQSGANNAGTVFKITPTGTLTTLYTFCSQGGASCTDGSGPSARLVQGSDGNFYGTTFAGGTNGAGTVFKITTGGTLTTLATVGGHPSGKLVQGTDGNFYGTTAFGGTIFKMTPAGTLTTLATVGGFPYAGLVQGTDGNFYGTTYVGGANCQYPGCGSVFKVTPTGTLTALYNFCAQTNCTDGSAPLEGLVEGTDGNLYGTTLFGGAHNDGTVFRLAVALPPLCTLTLNLSFSGSTLDLGFTLGVGAPATFGTWLASKNGVSKLWSVPVPVIAPPATFTVPSGPGFPNLGNVGVLAILSTPSSGIICSQWKTVNTGGAGPTVEQLGNLVLGSGLVQRLP